MKRYIAIVLAGLLWSPGCGGKPDTVKLEFRVAEREPSEGLTLMVFSGFGQRDTFYLHQDVLLTGDDVVRASVTSQNGFPAVAVTLTDEATKTFAHVTGSNIGRHLAMVLDGELISAPLIRDTITMGRAIVSGEFSDREAMRIADALTKR